MQVCDTRPLSALPNRACGNSDADYARLLLDLLPTGWKWPKTLDSVQGRLMHGFGGEMARWNAQVCAILEEQSPCTAVQTVDEWEIDLGLPDCGMPPLGTLALRKGAICARYTAQGGATPAYILSVINALGIGTFGIQPSIAHRTFGMPFTGTFTAESGTCVDITGVIGAAGSGAVLEHRSFAQPFSNTYTVGRQPDFDLLKCTLERIMPAHMCWNYR
jgi:hypothetical protein